MGLVQTVLTHPLFLNAVVLLVGWYAHEYYANKKYGRKRDLRELIRDKMAHKIATELALKYIDSDEIDAVEEEVNERMSEYFPDDVYYDIPDLKRKD